MGTDRDRALARIVGRRNGNRCGCAECPVCERRRAKRHLPVTPPPAPAPSVVLPCASEIDSGRVAALPVGRLEGDNDAR